MSRYLFAVFSTILLPTSMLAGCGTLGDTDQPSATLTTISGALTDTDGVNVRGALRVALVWHRAGASWDDSQETGEEALPYNIAEDVPVSAEFPARFSIELSAPPPEDVIVHVTDETVDTNFPSGSAYAVGALVVYDDVNGNGTLDLLDSEATTEIDALVGARGDLEVWYVMGAVPHNGEEDGGGQHDFLKLGYQVVEWEDEEGRILESVDLPLRVEDGVRTIICAFSGEAPSQLVDHFPGISPDDELMPEAWPTEGDDFECESDGLSFSWYADTCRMSTGDWEYLCPRQTECRVDLYHAPEGAPLPEGWPCPTIPDR